MQHFFFERYLFIELLLLPWNYLKTMDTVRQLPTFKDMLKKRELYKLCGRNKQHLVHVEKRAESRDQDMNLKHDTNYIIK